MVIKTTTAHPTFSTKTSSPSFLQVNNYLLMNNHHNDDDDNDHELNPLMTCLLPPQNHTPPPTEPQHFRQHHVSSLNSDIIIRQLPSEGLSFQLWPAATAFFSLLDTRQLHPFLRRDNRPLRLLELGSGTGLVGIAAAAVVGADVTVTDLAHVIPNLEYNVSANAGLVESGGGKVVAAELSWGNVEQMERVGRGFDVILGSDVVYHHHLYEPLLDTLKYLLLGDGDERVFVMAHLKRWKKEAVFFNKARKVFDVHVIHRQCPALGNRVGVIVYRFVRRPPSSNKGTLQNGGIAHSCV